MIKLTNGVEFRIKWAAPNVPYIEFGDNRIYLRKVDIKAIRQELNDFMTYYKEDFTPDTIHYYLESDERNDD